MASELPTFSVSDFLASINQTLEYAYPAVGIEGEVSGFKVNQNKYVFFDLKDAGGTVGCFMTVWQLRMPIEDGMKVVVQASPKVTAWGKFSLTVNAIRPSGEGSIKKSFDLLVAKLDKEGLFSAERKRPLPTMPSVIGVISSTQAAGYADFVKIVNARWGGARIEVAHTQVQGEAAPDQIIRALNYFNALKMPPDVIVIIRGGGSADDLSAFNDEMLARSIAASRVPTLVGVGHETDTTLADMVADVRAATPSEAAQIVVPDRGQLSKSIDDRLLRVIRRMESAVHDTERHIADACRVMLEDIEAVHKTYQTRLEQTERTLKAYDPREVLRRGYAVVRGEYDVGERVVIETYTKVMTAEVIHVKGK